MPTSVQENTTTQTPNFKLPDNVKIACEEVAKRCFEHTDPTKISTIKPSEEDILYRLQREYNEQHFISLLSRPTFNVAEIVIVDGDYFSLGVNLSKVHGKQSIYQVSADIVLQSLIFHNYLDKCWIPESDYQSKDEKGDEYPFATKNFICNRWTYILFDLEGEAEFLERYISPEQVLGFILDHVLWLYKQDPLIISEHFIDNEMGGKYFGERIVEQCRKLLDQYKNTDGKELFFRQAEKSEYPGNIEGFYNTFISNIELIFNIFSKNSQALLDFVAFNKDRALQELEALEKRKEILEKLIVNT